MTLFLGAQNRGMARFVQDALLRVAFVMQDVGDWLRDNGRSFENWVCPSGRRAIKPVEEYWELP